MRHSSVDSSKKRRSSQALALAVVFGPKPISAVPNRDAGTYQDRNVTIRSFLLPPDKVRTALVLLVQDIGQKYSANVDSWEHSNQHWICVAVTVLQ